MASSLTIITPKNDPSSWVRLLKGWCYKRHEEEHDYLFNTFCNYVNKCLEYFNVNEKDFIHHNYHSVHNMLKIFEVIYYHGNFCRLQYGGL